MPNASKPDRTCTSCWDVRPEADFFSKSGDGAWKEYRRCWSCRSRARVNKTNRATVFPEYIAPSSPVYPQAAVIRSAAPLNVGGAGGSTPIQGGVGGAGGVEPRSIGMGIGDWSAPGEVVLAVGDLHEPFAHVDALAFARAVSAKWKTSKTVFLGDEVDLHAVSDWDHDPDGRSPGDELEEALAKLKAWYAAFPVARICTSNHTFRAAKRAFKAGIPKAFLREIGTVLEAPATWHWADEWVIDGVQYVHGESFGGQLGAFKTAMTSHQSSVIGHIHSHAGLMYASSGPGDNLFGMNVGCLIDEEAYAFHYAKHFKARPWIGIGVVDRGVPHLIPMSMDDHGRWTGKL